MLTVSLLRSRTHTLFKITRSEKQIVSRQEVENNTTLLTRMPRNFPFWHLLWIWETSFKFPVQWHVQPALTIDSACTSGRLHKAELTEAVDQFLVQNRQTDSTSPDRRQPRQAVEIITTTICFRQMMDGSWQTTADNSFYYLMHQQMQRLKHRSTSVM